MTGGIKAIAAGRPVYSAKLELILVELLFTVKADGGNLVSIRRSKVSEDMDSAFNVQLGSSTCPVGMVLVIACGGRLHYLMSAAASTGSGILTMILFSVRNLQ